MDGQTLYLAMVICGFAAFAVTLFTAWAVQNIRRN